MSRQAKLGQLVKEGMEGADYSDEEEEDFELSRGTSKHR